MQTLSELVAELRRAVDIIKRDVSDEERDKNGRFAGGGSSGEGMPSHTQLSGMERVSGPLGSQGGNWYKDSSADKTYLAKPLESDAHGYNEIAAGAVYHEAGVKFPNTGLTKDENGKPLLVSEKIEGLSEKSASWWASHPDAQAKAAENFGVDALLSHWDVHGLSADNTLIDKNGDPVRIESGGAMAFRAMGSPKGDAFSPTGAWSEPASMRTSDQGRAMYGKMTDAQVADSLERAGKIDLGNVQSRWDALGIPRETSDPWMKTLEARQAQIPALVASLRGVNKALKMIELARAVAKHGDGKVVKYSEDQARQSNGEFGSGTTNGVHALDVDKLPDASRAIYNDAVKSITQYGLNSQPMSGRVDGVLKTRAYLIGLGHSPEVVTEVFNSLNSHSMGLDAQVTADARLNSWLADPKSPQGAALRDFSALEVNLASKIEDAQREKIANEYNNKERYTDRGDGVLRNDSDRDITWDNRQAAISAAQEKVGVYSRRGDSGDRTLVPWSKNAGGALGFTPDKQMKREDLQSQGWYPLAGVSAYTTGQQGENEVLMWNPSMLASAKK